MGLNLNNVLIGSDNLVALVAFYTKVLGDPTFHSGGWVGWRAGGGFLVVGQHSQVTGRGQQPGPVLIGFQTNDVLGEFERITQAGAQVVQAPFHPVDDPDGWLAFLADSDGNYFQLMCPSTTP